MGLLEKNKPSYYIDDNVIDLDEWFLHHINYYDVSYEIVDEELAFGFTLDDIEQEDPAV